MSVFLDLNVTLSKQKAPVLFPIFIPIQDFLTNVLHCLYVLVLGKYVVHTDFDVCGCMISHLTRIKIVVNNSGLYLGLAWCDSQCDKLVCSQFITLTFLICLGFDH